MAASHAAAASSPGKAVAEAYLVRMRARPALEALGLEVTPLAMSTNGRLHSHFKVFLRHLADCWSRATGVPPAVAKERIRQRVSVALQLGMGQLLRAEGQAVLAAARAAAARADAA